jgi:hypothetical protein
VPVRDFEDAELTVAGRWRSVVHDRELDLSAGVQVVELVGAWSVALFERVA